MKKRPAIFLAMLLSLCAVNLKAQIPRQMNCPSSKGENAYSSEIVYEETKSGLNFTCISQNLGRRFIPNDSVNMEYRIKIEGIPSCAKIERAYLWYSGIGEGKDDSKLKVISNAEVSQNYFKPITGCGLDKCWGYKGKYTYRADVTLSIKGNGIYYIAGVEVNPPVEEVSIDDPTLVIVWRDTNSLSVNHIAIEQNFGNCNGYCNPNGVGCLTIKVTKDSGYTVRYLTVADDYTHATPKLACALSDTLSEIYVCRGYYFVFEERGGASCLGKNEIEYIDETKKSIGRKR